MGVDSLGGAKHGRYAGIGIFAPGKLWTQLVPADGAPKPDPSRATRGDDEQIIVVVDTRTGEVRECGNYSGICASIQPWASVVNGAPVRVARHANALGDDSANAVAKSPAEGANSAQ